MLISFLLTNGFGL